MKEIQLPGRWGFPSESQDLREGRIFCLKLFERRNFSKIDAFAAHPRPWAGQMIPQFPNNLEAAAPGRGSKSLEMTRGWKFQMRFDFRRPISNLARTKCIGRPSRLGKNYPYRRHYNCLDQITRLCYSPEKCQ